MRPLFAIAPLALVLSLIGPTPTEANQSFANFVARFVPSKAWEQTDRTAATDKPGLISNEPALTAMQSGSHFDSSLSR